jgi:hypothetical protein
LAFPYLHQFNDIISTLIISMLTILSKTAMKKKSIPSLFAPSYGSSAGGTLGKVAQDRLRGLLIDEMPTIPEQRIALYKLTTL